MLPAGTRFGPYEIVAPLGAGGMGEVYRARDTKLDRDVALKILPDLFAKDPERLARFAREAKTLASLNHPHIAQVYGLEDSAIVMELVEGRDLSQIIAGPGGASTQRLPLDDVIAIARQIAEAIEAAHDAGVIHRDLKPANVKVRPDGTVKVLDFGLAKATDPGGLSAGDATDSPTLTARATQMGMIIGTAAYMAPEQAKGKPVDKRADVWAFGCVVYEMLTRRRTFSGDDVSDTLASVLRQDVDWRALPAATPPRLRRLLERCLERDPKQRLRDIGEARVELAKIEAGAPDSGSMPMAAASSAAAPRTRSPMLLMGLLGLLLAVSAVSAYVGYRANPPRDIPVVRFTIMPPPGAPFQAFAISPDGRHLAFLADNKGVRQIWVRALDSPEARPLTGTNDAEISLFWSPDSRTIGFAAEGKMKRVPVAGGSAQPICDAPGFSGASWGLGDIILFSPDTTSGLFSVPATGGTPSPVTTVDTVSGEQSHRWPSFMPDGRHFVYYARHPGASLEGRIMASSLDDPTRHTELLKGNAHASYARSARSLLFLSDRTLMAQAFDPTQMTLSGEPQAVADDVGSPSFGRVGIGQFSASDSGVLVHGQGILPNRQFVWFDRQGKELERLRPEGVFLEVRLSPTGATAAFRQMTTNNSDVWMMDLARGVPSRFTFSPAADQYSVWSPNGDRVVFSSARSGNGDLYIRPSNGAAPDALLYGTPVTELATDWSPDGQSLLFSSVSPSDVFLLPMTGPRTPKALVSGPANERDARFSPDGLWITYVSNESTRDEVFVQRVADSGGKAQVSTSGGTSPLWRADGKEIFYLAPDRKLMAVPITNGAPDGLPVALFQTQIDSLLLSPRFAPSRDGRKFLVNSPAGAVVETPLTVVLSWMPKKPDDQR
jgi:Tol biopolymer transport system component